MCEYGWRELIDLKQPAAGAALTYPFPGETFIAILSVRAQLVASAAVANRYVGLEIQDGDGNSVTRIVSPTARVAGTTSRTYFDSGAEAVVTSPSNDEMLPFTNIVFPPGFKARLFVTNIDVADQLSAAFLYVRRIPSGHWPPFGGALPYQP